MAQTKVYISQDYCIACGLCREVCPVGAIHPKFQDFHHWFEVVADACTGEGTCLEYCPAPGALVQTAESIRTGRLRIWLTLPT